MTNRNLSNTEDQGCSTKENTNLYTRSNEKRSPSKSPTSSVKKTAVFSGESGGDDRKNNVNMSNTSCKMKSPSKSLRRGVKKTTVLSKKGKVKNSSGKSALANGKKKSVVSKVRNVKKSPAQKQVGGRTSKASPSKAGNVQKKEVEKKMVKGNRRSSVGKVSTNVKPNSDKSKINAVKTAAITEQVNSGKKNVMNVGQTSNEKPNKQKRRIVGRVPGSEMALNKILKVVVNKIDSTECQTLSLENGDILSLSNGTCAKPSKSSVEDTAFHAIANGTCQENSDLPVEDGELIAIADGSCQKNSNIPVNGNDGLDHISEGTVETPTEVNTEVTVYRSQRVRKKTFKALALLGEYSPPKKSLPETNTKVNSTENTNKNNNSESKIASDKDKESDRINSTKEMKIVTNKHEGNDSTKTTEEITIVTSKQNGSNSVQDTKELKTSTNKQRKGVDRMHTKGKEAITNKVKEEASKEKKNSRISKSPRNQNSHVKVEEHSVAETAVAQVSDDTTVSLEEGEENKMDDDERVSKKRNRSPRKQKQPGKRVFSVDINQICGLGSAGARDGKILMKAGSSLSKEENEVMEEIAKKTRGLRKRKLSETFDCEIFGEDVEDIDYDSPTDDYQPPKNMRISSDYDSDCEDSYLKNCKNLQKKGRRSKISNMSSLKNGTLSDEEEGTEDDGDKPKKKRSPRETEKCFLEKYKTKEEREKLRKIGKQIQVLEGKRKIKGRPRKRKDLGEQKENESGKAKVGRPRKKKDLDETKGNESGEAKEKPRKTKDLSERKENELGEAKGRPRKKKEVCDEQETESEKPKLNKESPSKRPRKRKKRILQVRTDEDQEDWEKDWERELFYYEDEQQNYAAKDDKLISGKKYKGRYGTPYSVTGTWYIASGYLQDLTSLLEEFELQKGWRFRDFAKCWQKLEFTLIFRGRHNFKELLEFSEEVAFLTKRFLVAPHSNKWRVGALYAVYGLYYKHPFRHFFKIRLVKSEYEQILELVEPFRMSLDNPDPAYVFRKMEIEGAFYHTIASMELGIDFHSTGREAVDIKYESQRMAKLSHLLSALPLEDVDVDDMLMQQYYKIKSNANVLGDGKEPEKAVSLVEPSMSSDIRKTLEQLKEERLIILGLKDKPGKKSNQGQYSLSAIGSRRACIRAKAVAIESVDNYMKKKERPLTSRPSVRKRKTNKDANDSSADEGSAATYGGSNSKNLLLNEDVKQFMCVPTAETLNTPLREDEAGQVMSPQTRADKPYSVDDWNEAEVDGYESSDANNAESASESIVFTPNQLYTADPSTLPDAHPRPRRKRERPRKYALYEALEDPKGDFTEKKFKPSSSFDVKESPKKNVPQTFADEVLDTNVIYLPSEETTLILPSKAEKTEENKLPSSPKDMPNLSTIADSDLMSSNLDSNVEDDDFIFLDISFSREHKGAIVDCTKKVKMRVKAWESIQNDKKKMENLRRKLLPILAEDEQPAPIECDGALALDFKATHSPESSEEVRASTSTDADKSVPKPGVHSRAKRKVSNTQKKTALKHFFSPARPDISVTKPNNESKHLKEPTKLMMVPVKIGGMTHYIPSPYRKSRKDVLRKQKLQPSVSNSNPDEVNDQHQLLEPDLLEARSSPKYVSSDNISFSLVTETNYPSYEPTKSEDMEDLTVRKRGTLHMDSNIDDDIDIFSECGEDSRKSDDLTKKDNVSDFATDVCDDASQDVYEQDDSDDVNSPQNCDAGSAQPFTGNAFEISDSVSPPVTLEQKQKAVLLDSPSSPQIVHCIPYSPVTSSTVPMNLVPPIRTGTIPLSPMPLIHSNQVPISPIAGNVNIPFVNSEPVVSQYSESSVMQTWIPATQYANSIATIVPKFPGSVSVSSLDASTSKLPKQPPFSRTSVVVPHNYLESSDNLRPLPNVEGSKLVKVKVGGETVLIPASKVRLPSDAEVTYTSLQAKDTSNISYVKKFPPSPSTDNEIEVYDGIIKVEDHDVDEEIKKLPKISSCDETDPRENCNTSSVGQNCDKDKDIHEAASVSKLKTDSSKVSIPHSSKRPTCAFLFSPKFKDLSKLKEAVGETTGKPTSISTMKPRVPFLFKSSLAAKKKLT